MIFEAMQNEIFFFDIQSRQLQALSVIHPTRQAFVLSSHMRATQLHIFLSSFSDEEGNSTSPIAALARERSLEGQTFCRSPSSLILNQKGLLSPTWKADFERSTCFVLLFFVSNQFARFLSVVFSPQGITVKRAKAHALKSLPHACWLCCFALWGSVMTTAVPLPSCWLTWGTFTPAQFGGLG